MKIANNKLESDPCGASSRNGTDSYTDPHATKTDSLLADTDPDVTSDTILDETDPRDITVATLLLDTDPGAITNDSVLADRDPGAITNDTLLADTDLGATTNVTLLADTDLGATTNDTLLADTDLGATTNDTLLADTDLGATTDTLLTSEETTIAKEGHTDGEIDKRVSKITSFEELLEIVGTKGRWNLMVIITASTACLFTSFAFMSYEFLGATPDHWCRVPALVEANWTEEQIIALAIPLSSSGKREGCLVHNYNYTAAALRGFNLTMSNVSAIRNRGEELIACHSRVYNTSQYKSTIVTEWDLTCERRALYSTTQATTQAGTFFGSICYGHVLHRFGRRKGVLFACALSALIGFLITAAPNIETYIFLKFLFSAVEFGGYIGCFIIAMEVSSVSQRTYVGSFYLVPWSLGYMILPGIAYLVRPWRWLQAAFSLPLLFTVFYYWVLPESPRWLILNGNFNKALELLKRAAAINRTTLPSHQALIKAMENIKHKEDTSRMKHRFGGSVADMVKSAMRYMFLLLVTPEVRVRALVVFCLWSISTSIYFGVSLSSYNLSLNAYLYTFLCGMLEIPSCLLLWGGLTKLGRKKTVILLYLVSGASIAVLAALMYVLSEVPAGVKLFLSLSGKLAITSALQLIWIYTTELFSTEYRSRAVGEASTIGRIGSITTPYINDILGEVVVWGPSVVFSLASLFAATLVLILPETSNKKLTQTNKDFELNETTELACA